MFSELLYRLHISQNQFRIDIPDATLENYVKFILIKSTFLLEPKWYRIATMIFQSGASIIVAFECLLRLMPDVYFDTTGAAFAFPLVKLLSLCSVYVGCYVHYPTISSDMLKLVQTQRPSYNNSSSIATNITISRFKMIYYVLFAKIYGFVGRCSDLVIVNSTWTLQHISDMWKLQLAQDDESLEGLKPHYNGTRLVKIYPPCNTSNLLAIPIYNSNRRDVILSIGQFRPEKDHALQLRAMKELQTLDHEM
jgi:alpha-1,2-mannosyltransferase